MLQTPCHWSFICVAGEVRLRKFASPARAHRCIADIQGFGVLREKDDWRKVFENPRHTRLQLSYTFEHGALPLMTLGTSSSEMLRVAASNSGSHACCRCALRAVLQGLRMYSTDDFDWRTAASASPLA